MADDTPKAPAGAPAAGSPPASKAMAGDPVDTASLAHSMGDDALGVVSSSIDNYTGFLDVDPATVNQNITLRWVRNDRRGLSRARLKKYQYVNPKTTDGAKLRLSTGDKLEVGTDGHYVVGDLVLMWCPKRIHRVRQVLKVKQTKKRLGVAKKRFKKLAGRSKVDIIET